MIRSLLLLLLFPSLLGSVAFADTLRGPPDFQGFAIGDTLDEVRRKGHPDKGPGDDTQFVCTGDPLAKETGLNFAPEADMARIGARLCQFVKPPESGSTSEKWEIVSLKFGRHKLRVGLFFTPKTKEPAASERLYHIGIAFAPPVFDDFAAALSSRYGAPAGDRTQSIRLPSGATRDAKILIWVGTRYGIMLVEQTDDVELGGLTLLDNETLDALKRQAKDASATGAVLPPAPAPAAPTGPSATGAGTTGMGKGLPDPLGLRGINLGTTLADLRRQKHPDMTADEVRLICSGDPLGPTLPPDDANRRIGVVLCRFAEMAAGQLREVPMNVGGHESRVTFLVTPASASPALSERLYGILVETKDATFDALATVYVARFGPPDEQGRVPRQGMMWQNRRATLALGEQPGGGLGAFYYDRELHDAVDALKARKTRSGADKL